MTRFGMTSVLALCLAAFGQDKGSADFVVHEWGTFTSVSGADGVSIEWRPLVSSDLPKFVYSISDPTLTQQTRDSAYMRETAKKKDIETIQRMETPVTYFYTDHEMDVAVEVRFPKGMLTEWYPHVRAFYADTAAKTNGYLRWGQVHLMPKSKVKLPGDTTNHYGFARETDSAFVRVCNTGELGNDHGFEYEKFLFYRGVGSFDMPLQAQALEDGAIRIKNTSADKVNHVFAVRMIGDKGHFEFSCMLKAGESIDKGHHVYDGTRAEIVQKLSEEMERCLIMEGLYKKEAQAMVKTWKDSWFEEQGARVFYILPHKLTDQVLPLSVEPKPRETVRVMVGRIECITPEQEKRIESQIERLGAEDLSDRESATKEIKALGRFAEPTIRRVLQTTKDPEIRARCRTLLP